MQNRQPHLDKSSCDESEKKRHLSPKAHQNIAILRLYRTFTNCESFYD